MPDNKLNLFIAYAAEDVRYCNALRTHLAALERTGHVQIWYDGKIEAGQDWEASMVNQLEMADLVLLLVSADFIQSDVCYQTIFPVAMRLQKSGKAKVIPVIVRQCIWESTPLARMLPLPKNGIPPENKEIWQAPDECYTQIAYEVGQLVKDALLQKGITFEDNPALQTKPKKQYRQGKVLYLIPNVMEVQKKHPCYIRIAPEDIDLKTLKERLKNVEQAVVENIRIDSIMKAEIIDDTDGEAFDIDRIGELEQPIEEEGYTEWRYNITPLKQGTFSLCIKVSIMLRVPDLGKFVFKDVVVLDRDVTVTTHTIKEEQTQWAVANSVVPLAALLQKQTNDDPNNNQTNGNTDNIRRLLPRIMVALLLGVFLFPALMWAFMAEWVTPLYLSAAYDDYRQLHDERIAVKKNGKWGFVNKWGIQSTPPIYETVEDFNNAVAMVANPNQPPRQLHRDTSQGWLAAMFNPRDYLSNNPCQNITCLNGGKCVTGKCQCPDGFTGTYCEIKLPNNPDDPCQNINCLNGGTCVSGICQCPDGFTGIYCETKRSNPPPTNPCQNITCLNGGKCVTGKCQCPDGFTGTYCQTKHSNPPPTDLCQNITCLNGGKCVNGKCNCINNYTGDRCQNPPPPPVEDICKELRCSANGTCNPITKKCDCKPGYSGKRCQLYEVLCPVDCKPNGKCNPETKKCDCNPGYTGERCEKQDLCYNKNCNKGTCNPKTGKCNCPTGYTGENCEKQDPCSQKPDLVITNFIVKKVSPAPSQTLNYKVAFTATIKNTGGANASACNLYGEYSRNNNNQFYYGYCQPFAALNAGSERTVNGTLTIPGEGVKSAQIRLLIDATCSEEFLPVYVKVEECNENNNYSEVKTVAF